MSDIMITQLNSPPKIKKRKKDKKRTLKSRSANQSRTRLPQTPDINESILCHRPLTRTILSRTRAVPLILLAPRGQQHPVELHHSETATPRHTTGNPGYEAADLWRPVSSHRVHQTDIALQYTTTCWILRPKDCEFDPMAFGYCITAPPSCRRCPLRIFGSISFRCCNAVLHRGGCK